MGPPEDEPLIRKHVRKLELRESHTSALVPIVGKTANVLDDEILKPSLSELKINCPQREFTPSSFTSLRFSTLR